MTGRLLGPLAADGYIGRPWPSPSTRSITSPSPPSIRPRASCVLFGDESFLKRQVLAALKQQVLAGDDAEFSVTVVSTAARRRCAT